jgi:hypothetical protein
VARFVLRHPLGLIRLEISNCLAQFMALAVGMRDLTAGFAGRQAEIWTLLA